MILLAGIGNVFLGDDGFGCAVVERYLERGRRVPPGVAVRDFGIRGYDLALALEKAEVAVLVDATARGSAPGTIHVLELEGPRAPEGPPSGPSPEPHALAPDAVLRLLDSLGGPRPRLLLVGCEPLSLGSEAEPQIGLSPPVDAAADEAVAILEALAVSLADAASRAGGGAA